MPSNLASSLAWAVLSAVANGSFGVFAKIKPVADAQVAPPVFNLFVADGVVLLSVVVYLVYGSFTPWGILSGAIFVASTACSFFAILQSGLAAASAIWSGTSVLVSFAFGIWSGETLQRPWFAATGIAGIVMGIAGIAYSNRMSERLKSPAPASDDAEQPLLDAEEESGPDVGSAAAGLASAVVAGIFGGLVLAPMSFAGSDVQGLPYVGSMGPGVLAAVFPITAAVMRLTHESWPGRDQLRVAAAFGTLSGLVWACGNAAAAIAISGGAGYSLAMPIMQSGLFVSGIWGISLFGEIDRRAQPVYWSSGAVLITGVALLASAK